MCLNPRVCGIFRKVVILETVNKGKYKLYFKIPNFELV